MLFRFTAALLLVVAVSMTGVALEKQSLRLRSRVSRQYYQTDLLLELHARHRLKIQQLTAPAQLAALAGVRTQALPSQDIPQPVPESATASTSAAAEPARPAGGYGLPLLRWERPVNPAVID